MRVLIFLASLLLVAASFDMTAAASEVGTKQSLPTAVNARRAYPPSCLTYPLPDTPTGPVYSREITLYTHQNEVNDTEGAPATLEVWRVPCTRSGTTFKSATLMRIVPDAGVPATLGLLMPAVRISQTGLSSLYGYESLTGRNLIRIVREPNTIHAGRSEEWTHLDRTFVLENLPDESDEFPFEQRGQFDFNLPFLIMMDSFVYSAAGTPIHFIMDVPAYEPTVDDYPSAFEPLPISGYMSSNWFAPGSAGEGIVVQVFERATDDLAGCENIGSEESGAILDLSFNWFTYDTDGKPFWIYGDACVPAADPAHISIASFYSTGLGFAGQFDESDGERHAWGTVSFTFPSCNHMSVAYQANDGLPEGVPSGTGILDYQRVANINGLVCE